MLLIDVEKVEVYKKSATMRFGRQGYQKVPKVAVLKCQDGANLPSGRQPRRPAGELTDMA